MKSLVLLSGLFLTLNAQAMLCHIEQDRIYGVYKKVSGICDHGYRFRIDGPALGLKFEKTDYFGIACTGADKSGQYLGVGVDVGFTKGFTGALFVTPLSEFDLPSTKACAVGGLEEMALLYLGFSVTRLEIAKPTKATIEEARHLGLK